MRAGSTLKPSGFSYSCSKKVFPQARTPDPGADTPVSLCRVLFPPHDRGRACARSAVSTRQAAAMPGSSLPIGMSPPAAHAVSCGELRSLHGGQGRRCGPPRRTSSTGLGAAPGENVWKGGALQTPTFGVHTFSILCKADSGRAGGARVCARLLCGGEQSIGGALCVLAMSLSASRHVVLAGTSALPRCPL